MKHPSLKPYNQSDETELRPNYEASSVALFWKATQFESQMVRNYPNMAFWWLYRRLRAISFLATFPFLSLNVQETGEN
jgi:hypothetical protein